MPHQRDNLIVVSNRLPVVLSRETDGWHVEPGSGGLVTALAPVLRDRGGTWIGWPGTSADGDIESALTSLAGKIGYSLVPVRLTPNETAKYYEGFSNEIIWPLFHDMQSLCNFDPSYWNVYRDVNRKFAEVVMRTVGNDDFVWLHDYMREMGFKGKIGFFLHIPFPALDMFLRLPWRAEILTALTECDLVGFQTMRDRRNFVHCLRAILGGASYCGRGQVCGLTTEHREFRIGAFPISIDFGYFSEKADSDRSTRTCPTARSSSASTGWITARGFFTASMRSRDCSRATQSSRTTSRSFRSSCRAGAASRNTRRSRRGSSGRSERSTDGSRSGPVGFPSTTSTVRSSRRSSSRTIVRRRSHSSLR
jgi:trehalose-6-phosphate synthase